MRMGEDASAPKTRTYASKRRTYVGVRFQHFFVGEINFFYLLYSTEGPVSRFQNGCNAMVSFQACLKTVLGSVFEQSGRKEASCEKVREK